MKKIWKYNAKLILAIFITIITASGATYAATTMYDSNIVGYDNMTSGLRSANVQDALDELYGNVAEVILSIKNIIGNSTLTTSNQTLSGAINELDDKIGNIATIGTSGSWTYVKYANGIAECWCTTTQTRTLVGWGNIYYASGTDPSYNFPQNLFISTPVINYNVNNENHGIFLLLYGSASKSRTHQVSVGSGVAGNNLSANVYIHAIGKWK